MESPEPFKDSGVESWQPRAAGDKIAFSLINRCLLPTEVHDFTKVVNVSII